METFFFRVFLLGIVLLADFFRVLCLFFGAVCFFFFGIRAV